MYMYGACSIRQEFRQFACDNRLIEIRIVNSKESYIYDNVYENSLAELIMEPYQYKEGFYDRVDYLLSIMPLKERDSYLSKGNIANYEVIKGNLDKAIEMYLSIPFDSVIAQSEDIVMLWGNTCMEDIDRFIYESKNRESENNMCDINPSKIVENFTKIKSMLIEYGWKWN